MQTGQTPRPSPEQPDIQTETTEGRPSEPLISTTRRQGEGGAEGGATAREDKPSKSTKNRTTKGTRNRSTQTAKRGQGQACPTTRQQDKKSHSNKQNRTSKAETNHKAQGTGESHDQRQSQQRKAYHGANKTNECHKKGPDDFPQRETLFGDIGAKYSKITHRGREFVAAQE